MKRTLLFVVLLLLVACPVKAQDSLFIQRYDNFFGAQDSYFTTGVITSDIELWAFTYPVNPDWEIGKAWPLYKNGGFSLAGGGYFVYWSNSSDFFLLPSLFANYEKGRFQTGFDLMAYVPLTGQSYLFYTDEAWIGYRAMPKLRLGVTGSFFTVDGGLVSAGIGPGVKWDLDKKTTIGFRYQFGVKGGDSFRLQLNRTF